MHPEICQIRLDFEQFALAGKIVCDVVHHAREIEMVIDHQLLPSACVYVGNLFYKVRT